MEKLQLRAREITGGGLIQEHDGWVGDKGAGDAETPLLSTRKTTYHNATREKSSYL